MKKRNVRIILENDKVIEISDTTAGIDFIVSRQYPELLPAKIKRVEVTRAVSDIKNGSVFDHLYPGKEIGIDLKRILNLKNYNVIIIYVENEKSDRYGQKDFLKVKDWHPDEYSIKKIDEYFLGLPQEQQRVTLNIIKEWEIKEKYEFEPGKGLK